MPKMTKGIKNQESRIKEKKTSKIVIASKTKQSQDSGQAFRPKDLQSEARMTNMNASLTVDVFDIKGGKTSMSLPAEVFGVKINKTLLAQAVRVYLANQRAGSAQAKTRGEVLSSTRKIYQQKGTGRARHGAVSAPIFVHGGVAHGPRHHDFSLAMPKKMRKMALFSALTSKKEAGSVMVVKGMETLEGKTKAVAAVMKKIGLSGNVMLVMPDLAEKVGNIATSARNIKGVTLVSANRLTAYEVLQAKTVLFMQDAIASVKK